MKTLRHRLFALSTLLLVCAGLSAQESGPAPEQMKFSFSADWNCFRAADSLVFLEYSAMLDRRVLTYRRNEEAQKFSAEFLVEVTISQGESDLQNRAWRSRDVIDQLDEHNLSMSIPIIGSFTVSPGEYYLVLSITDLFGENRKQSIRFPVRAVSYKSGLKLSDVQLAMSIERDSSEGPFTKNGYKVMPNSANLYGIGMPILYCYAEVYNLAPATSQDGKQYTVSFRVLDADGREAKKFPEQVRQKPGNSSVIVQNLNVVTLVSGTYSLEVVVRDHETGATAASSHRFFVYRQDDFAAGGASFQKLDQPTGQGSPGLDAGRYDIMKEDELDLEFDWAHYIAKAEEIRTWKKLNLAGKREFIKEFWAARDETPGTAANEFKDQYLGRVQLANAQYRSNFKEGYKSDRGRILLLYDKPDEIERFPAGSDTREYQIWHYYSIQGGIYFVFADKRNMSDLELVHSTARGELYDPDWVRWIDANY